MGERRVGSTFTDAELSVIGRFLVAVLTLEQTLKWRIARHEHSDRARAMERADGLSGPLGKLIHLFKTVRRGDDTQWGKIDADLDTVRQARNAVAHGLVVLVRDAEEDAGAATTDPPAIRPQKGPPLFVFQNDGESFGCDDLAKLTRTAEELPGRLHDAFVRTDGNPQ